MKTQIGFCLMKWVFLLLSLGFVEGLFAIDSAKPISANFAEISYINTVLINPLESIELSDVSEIASFRDNFSFFLVFVFNGVFKLNSELSVVSSAFAGQDEIGARLGINKVIDHHGKSYTAIIPSVKYIDGSRYDSSDYTNKMTYISKGGELKVLHSVVVRSTIYTGSVGANVDYCTISYNGADYGTSIIKHGEVGISTKSEYYRFFCLIGLSAKITEAKNKNDFRILPYISYQIGVNL